MMTFKSCTTFLILLVVLEGSAVELTAVVRAGQERTLGEVMELLSKGQQSTEAEVSEMQSRLRRAPDDLDARTVLIGYYSSEQRESKNRDLLNTHLLWIIENCPDSVVAGTFYVRLSPIADGSAFWSAREAWLKHVEREDVSPRVLSNAAQFLSIHDTDLAIALLERALSEEPERVEWLERIAQLHMLKASADGESTQKAKIALAYLERAELMLDYYENDRRRRLLSSLARWALMAGETAKSESYAGELLELSAACSVDWHCGDAIHAGNIVLGRIALARDDVPAAKQYLYSAGKTPSGPQISSYGPDFTLASALLKRGESEAVIEYLRLCEEFWAGGRERLRTWAKRIQAGETPDFDR